MTPNFKSDNLVLMVIDDEPAIVAMFQHIVSASGIFIIAAKTAASAVEQSRANRGESLSEAEPTFLQLATRVSDLLERIEN